MTNTRGKSDGLVVPAKSPNKAEELAAEVMEGRGLAEGNSPERNALRTQGRGGAPSALERVRQAARKDRKQRFTALLHQIYDVERLRAAYLAIKRDAAAGVDGQTWEHYGENLEANLQDLSHRLRRGAYRARPVRRVYIPKVGKPGELRPLGVPALEDKIAQRATVEVLNAIYVAAKPAAVLADERSARETRPVVPVAIPGDGAGDQSIESPGVKVLVGKAKPSPLRQEGKQIDRSQAKANRSEAPKSFTPQESERGEAQRAGDYVPPPVKVGVSTDV